MRSTVAPAHERPRLIGAAGRDATGPAQVIRGVEHEGRDVGTGPVHEHRWSDVDGHHNLLARLLSFRSGLWRGREERLGCATGDVGSEPIKDRRPGLSCEGQIGLWIALTETIVTKHHVRARLCT